MTMRRRVPKPKAKRTLGLDTSSKVVGYGLFEGTELIDCGREVLVGEDHGQKLLHLYNFLLDLFNASNPDDVVIEMPYRSSAFGVLSWYIGAVLMAHYHSLGRELPKRNRMQPRIIKQYMGVPSGLTHDANKAVMVRRVNELFGLNLVYRTKDPAKRVSQDDTADGIAAAWAWIQKLAGADGRGRSNTRQNRARKRARKASTR